MFIAFADLTVAEQAGWTCFALSAVHSRSLSVALDVCVINIYIDLMHAGMTWVAQLVKPTWMTR